MSQKIREIIYSIVQKASMLGSTYEDLAMTKENYKKSFDVILDQAHQAIISAILEKMLKEKFHSQECNLWHDIGGIPRHINREGHTWKCNCGMEDFNQALAEMRERIKEI